MNLHFFSLGKVLIAAILLALLPITAFAHLLAITPVTPFQSQVATSMTSIGIYNVTNISSRTPITAINQSQFSQGFSLLASNCGHLLAPHQSCKVSLQFSAPASPQTLSTRLKMWASPSADGVELPISIVVFAAAPTYTITPSAGANGNISPNTPQTVSSGSNKTFTATANTGFTVDRWVVDGVVAQNGGTSFTISNINANHTVEVTFTRATFTITPSADANGSISPNTPQTVNYGDSIVFTATGNSGSVSRYVVNEWSVDGVVQQTRGTTFTLSNVTANHTVSVSFVLQQSYITSGNVYAMALDTTTDTLYFCGPFTFVGIPSGSGVPLNLTTGAPLTTYPIVNGAVNAVITDGNGGWYIGGNFSSVNGTTRNKVAHINSDYSLDMDFDPNVSTGAADVVQALSLSGSTLYLGGRFTTVGGQPRTNLAAVNAVTGTVTSWDPSPNNIINAIAIQNSVVYVGGTFTLIGGQSRNLIAALDINSGLATSWNAGSTSGGSNNVAALALTDSTIYVGGRFSQMGGQARSFLAEVSLTTGNATSWVPAAPNQPITTLALGSTWIYIGSNFSSVGGQSRRALAALDRTTGALTAFNANITSPGVVSSIVLEGASLYFAGSSITSVGGQTRLNAAAVDAASGIPLAWNPRALGVNVIASNGDAIYAGLIAGSFVNAITRNRLAAVDAYTGELKSWNPDATGTLTTLEVRNSIVYVGGSITTIGGQTRNNIAAIDGSTGQVTAWNPSADDIVQAIEVTDTQVYVGGRFSNVGGQARNKLAALNINTGLATSWNPNVNDVVQDIKISGSNAYIAGNFTTVGGQPRNFVAAVDLSSGLPTAWNPNANASAINCLVNNDVVYVSGNFTSIGGQTRNRIAAIDINTGLATAWNPDADNYVEGIAVDDDIVYITGSFTTVGGQPRTRFAALDINTGLPTSLTYSFNSTTRPIKISPDTLFIGGDFTNANNQPLRSLAFLSK